MMRLFLPLPVRVCLAVFGFREKSCGFYPRLAGMWRKGLSHGYIRENGKREELNGRDIGG
jgi:hypothetical protein